MKTGRTSYAFLMEMLWVCAFFLLSSSIFVLSFAKAEQLSRKAETLNQAVLAASNAMEYTFSTYGEGADEPGPALSQTGEATDGQFDSPGFHISVDTSVGDGLLRVTVQALDARNGSVLYKLEGAHRYPGPERTGV